jgi:hypothetical protein
VSLEVRIGEWFYTRKGKHLMRTPVDDDGAPVETMWRACSPATTDLTHEQIEKVKQGLTILGSIVR